MAERHFNPEREKFISAVHLFLLKNDQILLLRRYKTGYRDGEFSVPAGHLDGNEQAMNAIIREAREEVGIKIKPRNLEMVHIMHRKSTEERIDFFFLTKKWGGTPKILEPDKCDELKWSPIESLPGNTVPYIRMAIENYLNKEAYSEYGW